MKVSQQFEEKKRKMWSIQNLFSVYSEGGKEKHINIYSNGVMAGQQKTWVKSKKILLFETKSNI